MPNYTPSIGDVSQTVLSAFDTLKPENDDDRRINAELVQHLRQWFSSGDRILTDAAEYSINRFVNAELDFETDGNRGLGRMTDDWARFGGKYRETLRSLDSESIQNLRRAFSDQLLCGYLFAECLLQSAGQAVPRDSFPDGSEGVFQRWIPLIYYKFGPPSFDEEFSGDNAQSYYDAKGLWGHSTGDVIHNQFRASAIAVDQYAQQLIRQYFDAGVMLRVTEIERISDDQHYDTVTSGVTKNTVTNASTDAGQQIRDDILRTLLTLSEIERVSDDQHYDSVTSGAYSATKNTVSNASTGAWPQLPDDLLRTLSEDECVSIRAHEEEMIAGNAMALDDILMNCTNKMQFAKTYRVLRRDKREMLAKLRAKTQTPDQNVSDVYMMAMTRSTDEILAYKLRRLASHFQNVWSEPIENWAGAEGASVDRAGCMLWLMIFGASVASVAYTIVV